MKTSYKVQEKVGTTAKRWKAVTYELDSLSQCLKILEDHLLEGTHSDFRIVEIKIQETVINLDELREKIRKD